MAIIYDKEGLEKRVQKSLENTFQHEAIMSAQNTISGRRDGIVKVSPAWEKMRNNAARIRDEVLKNSEHYIEEFTHNAEKSGCVVRHVRTADDALNAIFDIVEKTGETYCLKAKSLLTEEIGVNEFLAERGIKVEETDCAEVILQTAESAPSHIVVPALHFDRARIRDLFHEKKGYEGSDDPEQITHFLREELRPEFLKAEVGIAGCNFAVASTGTVTLVTNEGNGRMISGFPRTLIVVMGIERMVPDLSSLDIMAQLLVTSAVGTKMTSSFTLNTGPRKDDEGDGPEHVHIVMVDNGRSAIMKGTYRSALRCIHCGACMNTCPVYRHIAGSGYGSIYPGPIGMVLTPLLVGYASVGKTPNACTLCGACADVCPVRVPLNSLIMHHRNDMVSQGYTTKMERRAFHLAASMLSHRHLYGALTGVGRIGMKIVGGKTHRLGTGTTWIPVLKGWTGARDLDIMERKFRSQFVQHKHTKGSPNQSLVADDRTCQSTKRSVGAATEGSAEKDRAPLSKSDLAEKFKQESEAIGIKVSVASPQTTAEALMEQIRSFEGSCVAYADDTRLDDLGIPQRMQNDGLKTLRWDAAHKKDMVHEVQGCDIGVSFCEAGIAESGTLAQVCDRRCGRAVSLLPPVHIAIVKQSAMVEHIADYLRGLDNNCLPSCLTFITGPSNTADIELVRVVGVHGPLQTGIIIVKD